MNINTQVIKPQYAVTTLLPLHEAEPGPVAKARPGTLEQARAAR